MVTQSKKRIAYLIHTFPLYSLTFIVDEIEMMRSLGIQMDLFGVRKPNSKEFPEHYAPYAKETHYALPINVFKHVARHFSALFRSPSGYISCIKFVLKAPKTSIRQKIKLLAYLSEAIELSPFITAQKYTHLHVHFLFGGAIVALFLKHLNGLNFSLTAHGTDFMVEKFLLAEKVKQADFVRIAALSNRDVLAQSIFKEDRSKIFQLPFGVDVSELKAHKNMVRSRIQCKQNTPIKIINVGRLVWQKGQVYLVEAAKILKESGLEFTLDIIGEGELRTSLEASILEYGLENKITLHGALTQQAVFQKMAASDIFVFSSVSEGFGIVLLEAMASGAAIATTNINAVPEIVLEGETGLLCEAKNATALAETLRTLCCDDVLRKRLALNALEDVVTRFDNQELVKKLSVKMMKCG